MTTKKDEFETIFIPLEELEKLPDYTVSQPVHVPVGARWKIISDQYTYVGERTSEESAILKIAVIIK